MTRRVLVVDDDAQAVEAVRAHLVPLGLDVVGIDNAPEAMRRLRAGEFDLAILEMMTPRHDTTQMLREIKLPRSGVSVKIIAMTAGTHALPRDYVLNVAARLGADATLPKPLVAADLRKAVEALLPKWPPAKP